MKVYTVSQINSYIKNLFENDFFLSNLYVEAEISNFKAHSSGHLYFTLKDSGGAINAVMFRSNASKLKFLPESGMKVTVGGYISLYDKTGQYQLYVTSMEPAGLGALYLAYEQLKARLERSGVFDAKYKKPIPDMPKTVAVITSPTGAAIRDIINVSGRRNPKVEIVVVPVLVQGENAAPDIVNAIDRVNRWGGADTIILGRGGGSIEDLWAFNEEIVARAIFNSEIPIISAVGHETDFTIADFISDMRAPTPSAAAEIAVPEGNAINKRLVTLYDRLSQTITSQLREYINRYRLCTTSYALRKFVDSIYNNQVYISQLIDNMYSTLSAKLSLNSALLKSGIDSIENRSPLKILQKGYSIVKDSEGNIISSAEKLTVGDEIEIQFNDGGAKAHITEAGE